MSDFQWTPPAGSIVLGDATYDLISVDGLGQDVNSNDISSIAGGVIATRDTLAAKTLTFTIEIWKDYDADSGAAAAAALEAFGTAWATTNTNGVLTFTLYGLSRKATGRPRKWAVKIDYPAIRGIVTVVAQFYVPSGVITDSGGTPVTF